jgi:IclR family transcriptional regulator, KDG regulon repressor
MMDPAGLERKPRPGAGRAPRVTPAVTRAFAILRLIRRQGPRAVRDIAAELDLPRSTVHELVHTLVDLGALAPAADSSGRFMLGLLLHELGSAYLSEVDLAREGHSVAGIVAEACGETVHLAALDGVEVVYLAKVDSIHAVRMMSAVGRRLPANCTAVGKALLSVLSDDELARRFGGEGARLPAMTPSSITSLEALKGVLSRVRALGYSLDDCESNADVRCVAAPVHDHGGGVVAAMSISVPTTRTGEDWPGGLVELVRRGAHELSRRLGHADEDGPSLTEAGIGGGRW